MPHTQRIEVAAPIDVVFAYLERPRKQQLWKDGLLELRFEDDVVSRGARFVQKIREGGRVNTYEGEVIEWDPPARYCEHIGNSAFAITMRYELRPVAPARTELHCTYTFTPKTWRMRLFELGLGWFTRTILKNQLNRLKELAEST